MNFLQKENETNSPKFLLWVLYAFIAVVLCYRLAIVFSYKHELVNGESNNLWNAINVAHGKPIYSNPEALPLEVFQYTPLSQFPIISLAKLINDNSPDYLYWITVGGRLLALLLNLLMGWFAYRIAIRVYEVKPFSGLLAACWTFVSLTHPNFAIRPDAMLLCALMGLFYLFLTGVQKAKNKQILLASAGVGFAILIKQDAFLMMAPFGLYLLYYGEWKKLIFSAVFFFLGIALALSLGQLLCGEHFIYSIYKGLQNEVSLSHAINVFDKANSLFGFHFTMAFALSLVFIGLKSSTQEMRLLALAVLCYMGFGFFTSFKFGAWVNYYSIFLCLTPILVVVFLKRLDESNHVFITNTLILLVIVNGGLFLFRQAYYYTLPWVRDQQAKKEYYQKYADTSTFKELTKIKSGQNVLTGDQLYRNFLATYTLMPNAEYYGVSRFDYKRFRSNNRKDVTFIFHIRNSSGVEEFLMDFFNLRKRQYHYLIETSRFTILESNGN